MADAQKDDFPNTAGLDLPRKEIEHIKLDSSSSKNKNNNEWGINFLILKINMSVLIFTELNISKRVHSIISFDPYNNLLRRVVKQELAFPC